MAHIQWLSHYSYKVNFHKTKECSFTTLNDYTSVSFLEHVKLLDKVLFLRTAKSSYHCSAWNASLSEWCAWHLIRPMHPSVLEMDTKQFREPGGVFEKAWRVSRQANFGSLISVFLRASHRLANVGRKKGGGGVA